MVKFNYGLKEQQNTGFILSKIEEKYNYSLGIDDKGKLIKWLRGATGNPCCSVSLNYDPKKNKQKKILRIKVNNVITYEDFIDVPFDNFLFLSNFLFTP